MLTWYAQEHPTACVAACVRTVLTSFDEDWTEAQVRALLGRPRLVHAGAMTTLYDDWNVDDLREALHRNCYPIVEVERHLLISLCGALRGRRLAAIVSRREKPTRQANILAAADKARIIQTTHFTAHT